ncbi:unnamed protein product [Ilex paraguariensis]|uniref:Uncharacterized protein n=1 Tax=Ilex paraguariensis TaxID=185542 RepID=A0ABC8ULF5_9AQUA
MKLSLSTLLNPHSKFASQKAFRLFFSSTSTQTLSSPKWPQTLYRRISPVGDPNISIVPVLDQWVREGKEVQREELQWIIKELKFYRRYKHALEKQIPPKPPDVSKTFASLFTSPKNSVLFLNPTTCSGLVLGSNSDIVPVYYGKISSMPPSIYKVDQNSSSNQIPSNVQIPSFTQISSVTHIPSNGKILSNSHNPSSVLVSSSDSFPSNVQISSISQIPSIVQVSSISHESLVNPVSGQIASDIPEGTLRNLISSVEAPKPAKRVVYNNGELGMYWSLEETQQLSKGFHQSLIGKCAYGKPSVGVIKEFIKSK